MPGYVALACSAQNSDLTTWNFIHTPPMSRPPNILVLITDQQRADHLGCAGNPVLRTPNIDRIAAEGVRFPRGHGVRTNGIPLDPDLPTFTGALLQAGYHTHAIGKLHLNTFQNVTGLTADQMDPALFPEAIELWQSGRVSRLPSPYYGIATTDYIGGHGPYQFGDYISWLTREHPEALPLLQKDAARETPSGADQSWKSSLPAELHSTTWVTDRAIDFLGRHDRSQPFFLWTSIPDPHHPYCPPAPYDSLYDPADVALPVRRQGELDDLAPFFREIYEHDLQLSGRAHATRISDAHMREIIAHTYGMITLIDDQIGRILDTLSRTGLREDTLVIFMSDHGDMMGDHWMLNKGPFHFEGLLRVPFIWSWPGHVASGATIDAPVSLLDFVPTLSELSGVPMPEGRVPPAPEAPQALPALPGQSLVPLLRAGCGRGHAVALVENDEDYLGLRLRTLITPEHKLTIYADQPFGELFDLVNDPSELHNRFHDPAFREARAKLTARLLNEVVRTDSTLPRRLSHA
jgi:arylsulfatase A-like enzyme